MGKQQQQQKKKKTTKKKKKRVCSLAMLCSVIVALPGL